MTNRTAFFDSVRAPLFHGAMKQTQVDGCNVILDAWEKAFPAGDIRCLAYVLATPWWETEQTMQPIEERGHGRGHAYGVPTGPWHQVYDGKGFVQDTWYANYVKQNPLLHKLGILTPDESIVKTPSLVMRPDVAAAVLIYGMSQGWFTGKKLSDYIHGNVCDFTNARRIINGTDKASTVAAAAFKFYAAVKAATATA